jgi:DNA-binding SARP family transcriptional activator
MIKGKKYGEVAIPTSLAITPEEIFDYFAWEVFNRLEPPLREFLLRTALFPTFSPKMAERIYGDASAQQLPADLNRNNYFMEKRSGNEYLYRYHPLFREFLLKRGESTYPAEQLYALRQQAFDILSDNGYIEDAAIVAVSGKNWPGLTRLIGNNAQRFIEQGRTETVLNWLSGIPEDIVAAHAELQFWKGTCCAACHPESAQYHLTRSFDLFRENGDRSGMLMSWSGVSDLFLHCGEFAAVENWFLRLQDILAADPAFPSREIEARVTMSAFNLMAFRMSDHPDIEYWHERTYDIVMGQLKLDRNRRIDCAIHLLVYYVWQGIHSRAAIIAEFLHNAAQSSREFDLRTQTARTGEALYYSLSAQHERCYETVRQAVADSEQNGIHVWTAHILCHGASAAIGAGNWEAAGSFLGKIEAIVDESRRLDLGYFHLLMGWKKMCSDDLAGAREHQKLSIELLQGVRFLAAESLSQVNMAEILVGLGNLADARTHLDHAYCLARQLRSDFLRFFCLLVDAQLNFQQGGYPEGDERLREAFCLARIHGFVTTFSWRAPVMARLCARALDRGIESGYVAHLVKVRKLGSYPPDADIGAWPWPVRIHTLGTFVLEIDGKPLRFSGKVQKKPLEMLKLLVALGGAERREGEISDLLWPDADGDTARNSFKVTLRRLRELLGVENVLQIHDGRLMLDRRQCWTDVQAFEQLLSAPLPDNGHDDGAEAIRSRRKALSLYRGPFLSEDADKSWAITCRKRLQTRFTSNILALGAIFLANGDHGRAIDCFLKGLDAEPVSEELYQQLMQSYLDAGLRSEAVAAYQRCSKLLFSLLGVAPSPKTTAIYQAALSA